MTTLKNLIPPNRPNAMTLQPTSPVQSRSGILFCMAALALAGPVASETAFPEADQLQALETAAEKSIPMPPELAARLCRELPDIIAVTAKGPLSMLWMPEGFQLDAKAFQRAFCEDWNLKDDVEERSNATEEDLIPWLPQLFAIQHGFENDVARAHASLPGVAVYPNGAQVETQSSPSAAENVSILKADSLEVRDLRGNLIFATPIGEKDMVDMADLPEPVAELVDQLPSARAWVFLLPTRLLMGEAPPTESPGKLVLILQKAAQENRPQAWESFARRLAPAFAALPRDPVDSSFRRALSAYAGHMAALRTKHVLRALPAETGIEAQQLATRLLQRLNRDIAHPLRPPANAQEIATARETLQACRNLLEARRTEVERHLLRLHAGKPGVHTAPSGVQYSVEPGATAEENHPFSSANFASISRIGGTPLFEQSMSPGELNGIAEIAESIPDAKSWTFYVPGHLTGEYRLPDDMEAGVVLTFRVCEDDDQTNELPRPETPSDNAEESGGNPT